MSRNRLFENSSTNERKKKKPARFNENGTGTLNANVETRISINVGRYIWNRATLPLLLRIYFIGKYLPAILFRALVVFIRSTNSLRRVAIFVLVTLYTFYIPSEIANRSIRRMYYFRWCGIGVDQVIRIWVSPLCGESSAKNATLTRTG